MRLLVLAALVLLAASCGNCGDSTSQPADAGATNGADVGSDAGTTVGPSGEAVLLLQFGDDLEPAVRERIEAHLRSVATRPVLLEEPEFLHPESLVIGFGDVPVADSLLGPERSFGPEGYVLRTGTYSGAPAIAVDGDDVEDAGLKFGAYALLEELGFAFLHPLAPTLPPALPTDVEDLDVQTEPRWWFRGLQIHTMHPLELTELLQGWGPDGWQDEEGWRAMLPEWEAYLEWSLANGQNHVHWVLLAAPSWAEFAGSQERIDRLAELVNRAHAFGIRVGVDVPIRLQQQHAWRMIEQEGQLADEISQIEARVDLLMKAQFDYLATESGSTEFTAPDDERMLAWMDALASHLSTEHQKPTYIKVHASSGQTVENFTDRDTGEPLNFNFLPTYAVPEMGVMPHTVQHYALDDPAPTYGNEDFSYMREFLQEEVGRRPTVWHPETAYWVSFDVDVPLFLPIYAHTRVRDLRLLASDEEAGLMGRGEHAGKRMDGQVTFSSGWEWGYWLQEVVTARASWDPRLDIADDAEATRALLGPVVRPFGDAADDVADLILRFALAEQELLIDGVVNGNAPAEIELHNGQAYMQGTEAWDDIADIAAEWLGLHESRTQPDKLGMVEMRTFFDQDKYLDDVNPLLDAMDTRFAALAAEFDVLRPRIPENALPLFDDLADAAKMTALRAHQVHALYDYVSMQERDVDPSLWEGRIADARGALDEAATIVARREQSYRVPAERIAGWRPNPTAYQFTYLWTVRSLYYWWRDEAKAILVPRSPCYLNIINPIAIAFGEGNWSQVGDVATEVFDTVSGIGEITDCLGAPSAEPTFPPDGVR